MRSIQEEYEKRIAIIEEQMRWIDQHANEIDYGENGSIVSIINTDVEDDDGTAYRSIRLIAGDGVSIGYTIKRLNEYWDNEKIRELKKWANRLGIGIEAEDNGLS